MMVLLSLFFLFTTQFQGPPVEIDNVPFTISACLQSEANRSEVSRRMNPFYLRGDFNGDGNLDYAVLVQERKSGKQGFAFCFAGTKRNAYVVGAGNAIALEGGIRSDDLRPGQQLAEVTAVAEHEVADDDQAPAILQGLDSQIDRAARALGVHAHPKNQLRYKISRSSLQPIA